MYINSNLGHAGLTAGLAIQPSWGYCTFLLYSVCLPGSPPKALVFTFPKTYTGPHTQYAFTQWVFHHCLPTATCLNQLSLSVGSYAVYEITALVGLHTAATTGSATVNSHILRMETVVRTKWVSWAGGQPWFCTNAIDIVQPDSSTCRPKPAEQKSLRLCIPSPYMASYSIKAVGRIVACIYRKW